MAEVTLKENNSENIEDDLPILPPANIFIKGEPDFEIVRISSSEEYDDNEDPYVDSFISEDNVVLNIDCDDDDDILINEDGNHDDEEGDDEEDDSSQLDVDVWPVHVKLETDVGSIDVNDSEDDRENSDDDEDDDSYKDSDDSYGDNSFVNSATNGRKRKKLSKVRKKRNVGAFTCNLCYLKFNSNSDLSIHTTTSHSSNYSLYVVNNKYTCLLCKKEFQHKSSLDDHISEKHTEKKTVNCIKCNKSYEYRSYVTSNNSFMKMRSSAASTYEKKRHFTCFHCSLNRS